MEDTFQWNILQGRFSDSGRQQFSSNNNPGHAWDSMQTAPLFAPDIQAWCLINSLMCSQWNLLIPDT